MFLNLTPHPIRLYPPETPDRVDPDTVKPVLEIQPCPAYKPARIGEITLGTQYYPADDTEPSLTLLPVENVEYASHGGLVNPLPKQDEHSPHRTWYIVPLVVALQQTYVHHRSDVVCPYMEVRNLEGTVIGCRLLARPV